jgi:hypothetical protein
MYGDVVDWNDTLPIAVGIYDPIHVPAGAANVCIDTVPVGAVDDTVPVGAVNDDVPVVAVDDRFNRLDIEVFKASTCRRYAATARSRLSRLSRIDSVNLCTRSLHIYCVSLETIFFFYRLFLRHQTLQLLNRHLPVYIR